jgi:hypothetical protein
MGNVARIATRAARRFIRALPQRVNCDGCGQPNGPKTRIVSGPGVYMCADCFHRAASQLAPRRAPPNAVRCRFCRQLRSETDVTAVGSVTVCADCLGSMESVHNAAGQTSRAPNAER